MSIQKFPATIIRNGRRFLLSNSLPQNASAVTADFCGHSHRLSTVQYCTRVVKPVFINRAWPVSIHISGHLTKHLKLYRACALIHTTVPPAEDHPRSMFERKICISQPSIKDPEKVLTFDVTVLDTFPDDVDQENPTVVAVHGMPGAGRDFLSLGQKLKEKGIRLVAPTCLGQPDSPIDPLNLPDIDFTTEGRTRSLQLILIAMNIYRIDMLLGHSAGAWTVYEAGSKWSNVRSLCAVNPGGAEPNRRIRPYFFLKIVAMAFHWPLFRKIFTPPLYHIYRWAGFREVRREDGGFPLVITQQYITNQQFENVPINAKVICMKQIPFIFIYTLNDKFIEPSIFANMAYTLLGIPVENTVVYSEEKTPSRDPLFIPEGWLARCLMFVRGGHIAHVAHETELVTQIENVLMHLRTKKASDSKKV